MNTILGAKYEEAKRVIEAYHAQMINAKFGTQNLHTNQRVHSTDLLNPSWVTSMRGDDVLVRSILDVSDPECIDTWINVSTITQIDF